MNQGSKSTMEIQSEEATLAKLGARQSPCSYQNQNK
jgi:hypothetical protein